MMKINLICVQPIEKEDQQRKLHLLSLNINTKIKEKGYKIRLQGLSLYQLNLLIPFFLLNLNGEKLISKNGLEGKNSYRKLRKRTRHGIL